MKKLSKKINRKKGKAVKAKARKTVKAKVVKTTITPAAPVVVAVPRDTKVGKSNQDITHLVENLCLALFDQDNTGDSFHLFDITKRICPAVRHSYPEIKSVKHLVIYVAWAMKTLCWNNRAKLIAQDWFESPLTATDGINDSLPEGSPWEARMPGKFGPMTTEDKRAWNFEVDKAKWAVEHFRHFFAWDDQKIIDTLYAGATPYAPKSVETALRQMEHDELEKEISRIFAGQSEPELVTV